MVEIVRTERVGEDGMVHVAVPNVEPGQSVEVTVRESAAPRVPDDQGRYRTAGGLEGKIRIADDFDAPLSLEEAMPKRRPGRLKGLFTVPPEFDDPIPGMEEYS